MRVARRLIPAVVAMAPALVSAEDAALTAEAIRMCRQNFELKEEAGPMLEGPALVLEAGRMADNWRVTATLPSSADSAPPKTVFCARTQFEEAGKYTDGSVGKTEVWEVSALSWPDGRVRRKGRLYGTPPQFKKTVVGAAPQNEYGRVNARSLLDWLKGATSEVLLASLMGSAVLSQDGKTLAVAAGTAEDRSAQIFEWPSQAMRQRIGKGWPVGFLPDGRLVFEGKKGVELWDAASGRQVGSLPVSGFPIAYSRDLTRAVATKKRTDTFWDLQTGRARGTPGADVYVWNESTALSSDGRYVCAVANKKFAIWDADARRAVATFELEGVNPTGIDPNLGRCALSGDGKVAVLSVREGLYRLSADGSEHRLGELPGYGICLGVSSSGRWLAVGGAKDLVLWDLPAGKEVLRTPSQGNIVCRVEFSLDDSLLWLGSRYTNSTGRTEVWDARRLIAHATGK
jgi:hypothetical protein